MAPFYVTSSLAEYTAKLGFFSECPIQWDRKQECLRYKSTRRNAKVKMWHFNLFLTVDTIASGAFVYDIFQIVRSTPENPYIPLPVMLIMALLGVLTFYVVVNHVMITLYGKDAVNGWNEMVKIEGQVVGRIGHGGKFRLRIFQSRQTCVGAVFRVQITNN